MIVQHVLSNVLIVGVKVADLKIRLPTLLFIFAPGKVTDDFLSSYGII